jgi:hypothetical protein
MTLGRANLLLLNKATYSSVAVTPLVLSIPEGKFCFKEKLSTFW